MQTQNAQTDPSYPFPPVPESGPITLSCQCGAIDVVIPGLPEEVNECPCSICYRYGVGWGYWNEEEVQLTPKRDSSNTSSASSHDKASGSAEKQQDPIIHFTWKEGHLSFEHCAKCGTTVMYTPTEKRRQYEREEGLPPHQVGVNMKLIGPKVYNTFIRTAEE